MGFADGSDGKESAYNAGDSGSIPGSGRFPGEGNDYPLQYSCLQNSMDRGAWWVIVHGIAKSHSVMFDSVQPKLNCVDCPGPLSMTFSRQEYWSG